METGETRRRNWADMNEDVLSLVFCRLEIPDLITAVPFVCSSWRVATNNPHSWKDLDFRNWDSISRRLHCRRKNNLKNFADLLDFCIDRSDGCVDSIYFPEFADVEDLLFVAERCPSLLYFRLESEEIPHDSFCKAISKLQFLKGMEVHESLIFPEVLLHVQKCCSYFSELKLFAESFYEEDASVICECLPRLQKLAIPDCRMHRYTILTLLDGLKELEYLDISGYETSGITTEVLEKASRLKVFLWDSLYGEGECDYCPSCEKDYLPGSPCCMDAFDTEVMAWREKWMDTHGHYPDDENQDCKICKTHDGPAASGAEAVQGPELLVAAIDQGSEDFMSD